MTEWSITIDTEAKKVVTSEQAFDILDEMKPYHGSVSAGGSRKASVTITHEARDLAAAASGAIGVVRKAFGNLGIEADLSGLQIMTTEAQREDLERPLLPDLVGVAEIADILGVTRQRVSSLVRGKHFPKPLAELASGPVWPLPWVMRFIKDWARKSGRPALADARDRPVARPKTSLDNGTAKGSVAKPPSTHSKRVRITPRKSSQRG